MPANPERNAYFGELHVHSSYSIDANVGGSHVDPRKVYEFARGDEVSLPNLGIRKRISTPLDFAAVTDHGEGFGMMSQCYTPSSGTYWSLICIGVRYKIYLLFPQALKALTQNGNQHSPGSPSVCGNGNQLCKSSEIEVWQDIQNAANEFYQPGKFTTFIGYEYSPSLGMGGQIHRNVIYRGSNAPDSVFSATDGFAEELYRWLDKQCTGTCKVMTIPHSPNMSWGLMFGDTNSDATPVTRENLALRSRYERLVEIFQYMGSSECARGVGTVDEECGFENLFPACTSEESKIDPITGQHASRCVTSNDMVRGVLRKGLQVEEKLGFNPFKLGIVGSTDGHNGLAGSTTQNDFVGHAILDSTPEMRLGLKSNIFIKALGAPLSSFNPGGLTGVWAEENTREAIWDGLYRRETWGTSGTRIRLRFFGGIGLPANLHKRSDRERLAYLKAVPMGGDLPKPSAGKVPTFAVWAMQDINSARLQRIQIVKGWVEGGSTFEKVYDVACSDGIRPDPKTHKCGDNGAKVNLEDCSISAAKGATELATTWTDPDFRREASAFYYARVLENPICRYTQWDSIRLGVKNPTKAAATVQERAWSSPIWYESSSVAWH
jgi:hypothetical protein